MTDELKRCRKCGEWKPATREYFYINRATQDGLCYRCITCTKEIRREEYAANPDKFKGRGRRYREENRQKDLERKRKYRSSHIDARTRSVYADLPLERRLAANERNRRWRADHREQLKEAERRYRADHLDEVRERSRIKTNKRRATKRNVGGTYSAADLAAIRAAQTDKKDRLICWRCGKPIKDTPHLDHWIPLSKGGTNDPGNLRYMHAKCNISKGAKLPHEIGRLI